MQVLEVVGSNSHLRVDTPIGAWRDGKSMKLRAFLTALIVAALAFQGPASAAPARTTSVTALAQTATWTGATADGANVTFLPVVTDACNTVDARSYCDDTLVKVDVLATDATTQLKFRIADFGKAVDDFDLRVYRSNAAGTRGQYLGAPDGDIASSSPLGADDPRHTFAGDPETKVVNGVVPGEYYLVRVVYFAVASSNYKGSAQLLNLPPQPEPAPTPTDEPAPAPEPTP